MRQIAISLTLLLALLVSVVASADQPCALIQTSGADNPGKTEAGFSATATGDIVFRVLLKPEASGERLLELRVFTPRGHLYQSLAVPLTVAGGPAERKVPGYPRPVKTRVPAASSHGGSPVLKVDVEFPVGGTMIQSGGLYGTWRVEAALDGANETCGKPTAFTIVP